MAEDLVDINIGELVESGRVNILDTDEYRAKLHQDQLADIGSRLSFFVGEETNSNRPLEMNLITTAGYVLVPNTPVSILTYERYSQDSTLLVPKFTGSAIELPENHAEHGTDTRRGYSFENIRRAVSGEPYFLGKDSGWKRDGQGKTEHALFEFDFDRKIGPRKSMPTSLRVTITYKG